jgi:predicted AAA+ superfamily ATPase
MLATVNGMLPGEAECQDDLFVYELTPMTFDEFLKAGKGRKLWKYIENQRLEGLPEEVRASVDTMLDAFLVTGGMPEAVNAYYKNENFEILGFPCNQFAKQELNSNKYRYKSIFSG